MKRSLIYIITIVLMLGVAGCNDFLDTMPDNRTELKNEQTIAKLLVSAYSDRSYAYICEMASDNADDNERHSAASLFQEQVWNWQLITQNDVDSPYYIWERAYRAIATANQVLEAIEKQGNPSNLQMHKGEALMCRAWGHYVLGYVFCNTYGPNSDNDLGIPYVTEPESDVFVNRERGTVADLYRNINKDIEAALPLINDLLYEVPKYHFNKKAAYAFAARFNLYYRNYEKVVEYASRALGEDPSLVLRDWKTWGSESPNGDYRATDYIDPDEPANLMHYMSRSVWQRVHGINYSTNHGSRYTHNLTIAYNETLFSDGPWGKFSRTRDRSTFYWHPWYTEASCKVILRKYREYFEVTATSASGSETGRAWNITTPFTTDGTLLIRAEAKALAGDLAGAYQDLVMLMEVLFVQGVASYDEIIDYYASLPYYTPTEPTAKKAFNTDMDIVAGSDKEHMLHFILNLKRILFLHEGERWGDLKRYGMDIYRRVVPESGNIRVLDHMPPNDLRRAFQIPTEVIQAGMTPNPR